MPIWSFYDKVILSYLPVHLIFSRLSSPRSPAVAVNLRIDKQVCVWDLNCLKVVARHA